MATVAVQIGGRTFEAGQDQPVHFGRADEPGVVGLDPRDMGISARAGSIECALGLWWLINRSRTRPLYVESSPAASPVRVECGGRVALTSRHMAVIVRGSILTHRIDVHVPAEVIEVLQVDTPVTTGTIDLRELRLSERDRDALAAVCCGYLRPFPRRDPHPLSYHAAAVLLGPPWTKVTVRKQIERLKVRLARSGLYFEGPHANDELAEHLLDNGLLDERDLARLGEHLSSSGLQLSGAPRTLHD